MEQRHLAESRRERLASHRLAELAGRAELVELAERLLAGSPEHPAEERLAEHRLEPEACPAEERLAGHQLAERAELVGLAELAVPVGSLQQLVADPAVATLAELAVRVEQAEREHLAGLAELAEQERLAERAVPVEQAEQVERVGQAERALAFLAELAEPVGQAVPAGLVVPVALAELADQRREDRMSRRRSLVRWESRQMGPGQEL